MREQNTSKLILVVEDNQYNMKLAVDLLQLAGFAVLKAINGQSALNILKDKTPHLILLDLRMPGMDGFEVFRRIKENKNLDATKVVAFTASAMKDEEDEIKRMGFDAFALKPIDTVNFVKCIESIIQHKGKGDGRSC